MESAHAREGEKRNRVESEQRATLLLLVACPLRWYCTGSCHCTPRFHLLPKKAPSNRKEAEVWLTTTAGRGGPEGAIAGDRD